jgi:hypothetical protein
VGQVDGGVQKKFYGPYLDDPAAAARDADLILYKLRGAAASTNFPLASSVRAQLDGMTLSQLLASFKNGAPGGGAFAHHAPTPPAAGDTTDTARGAAKSDDGPHGSHSRRGGGGVGGGGGASSSATAGQQQQQARAPTAERTSSPELTDPSAAAGSGGGHRDGGGGGSGSGCRSSDALPRCPPVLDLHTGGASSPPALLGRSVPNVSELAAKAGGVAVVACCGQGLCGHHKPGLDLGGPHTLQHHNAAQHAAAGVLPSANLEHLIASPMHLSHSSQHLGPSMGLAAPVDLAAAASNAGGEQQQ